MSDQSQTTTNTPAEPVLCAMGCGFFGNTATKGYCSKCWRDSQKKQGLDIVAPSPETKKGDSSPSIVESPHAKKEVENETIETVKEEPALAPKKKGKKKKSYKSLMAGMMTGAPPKDVDKEREALRKVTGGGEFTKIEKI